jgi:protein-disulfide isomerase
MVGSSITTSPNQRAKIAEAQRMGLHAIAAIAAALMAATAPAKGLSGVFYDPAYELGSPKAKVVVEEYASAVCSHCARFDDEVFPALKARYIDTGKIRFRFREFLTEPSDLAASAFLVARCAGKDKYFKAVEDIFKAQPEMFSGKPGSEPVVVLMRIASANGVDAARFHACLGDPVAVDMLQRRLDHALTVDHVQGTPTVIVNGKTLSQGRDEWTIEKLSAAIDAELKSPAARRRR